MPMKTLGRDCTLTAKKCNNLIALPFSQETIRVASKGFSLPGVIGNRNREVNIQLGTEILGCFVTRLEYINVYFLFSLLLSSNDNFDLLISHVISKSVYKNLNVKSFELRAENNKPFYFRLDVKDNNNSYVDNWKDNVPEVFWNAAPTYFFDGHLVICDLVQQPLIYRFELIGDFRDVRKFSICLYYPLSDEQPCELLPIKKLLLSISVEDGIYLELNNLIPADNLADVNTSDEILVNQTFNIQGEITLVIRNSKEFKVVTL